MALNLPVHRNGKICHSRTFFGSTGLEEWPYFEPCMGVSWKEGFDIGKVSESVGRFYFLLQVLI